MRSGRNLAEDADRTVSRRRYLARFDAAGSELPAPAVFETGADGWVGVTAFGVDDADAMMRRGRRSTRVYRLQ